MNNYIFFCIILILYPLLLYPITLKLIRFFYRFKLINVDYDFDLENKKIDFLIVAYNEEETILNKLKNTLKISNKLRNINVYISSDNSTDKTNQIVEKFIQKEKLSNFHLINYDTRQGKTKMQNLFVRKSKSDFIVFSDSNSIWNEDSIQKLLFHFRYKDVSYVCGKLEYSNSNKDINANAESTYWNLDLSIRKMESEIYSIVGGNGAIYAIRAKDYIYLPDLLSHDGFMPTELLVKKSKLSKFEFEAVAKEKATTSLYEEFKRKIRMNRGLPFKSYYRISKFNIFRYGLFSYFYVGHKFIKHNLYFIHSLLASLIIIDFIINTNVVSLMLIAFHLIFLLLAFLSVIFKIRKKIFYFPLYYLMTITAQVVAVYLSLINKNKPYWEKTKSSR